MPSLPSVAPTASFECSLAVWLRLHQIPPFGCPFAVRLRLQDMDLKRAHLIAGSLREHVPALFKIESKHVRGARVPSAQAMARARTALWHRAVEAADVEALLDEQPTPGVRGDGHTQEMHTF